MKPCITCGELCPYDSMVREAVDVYGLNKPSQRPLLHLEHYQIIPPCENANKNFFGIKNEQPYSYYNNMEVPYLIDAIEFIINEQDTSLADYLKLLKIKSQLQENPQEVS